MRKNGRTFFYEKNKSVIFAYVMMLCVFVLYVASQPNFFSAYGVKSTFDQFQPLTYAALAQTLVILTGGVDLSVGAAIGVANCIAATYMVPIGDALGSPVLGILIVSVITLLSAKATHRRRSRP